jgi:hypothetical protein
MDLTEEQVNQAYSGRPVVLTVPGKEGIFVLRFFKKGHVAGETDQDPELDAFLNMAEEEAARIFLENPY